MRVVEQPVGDGVSDRGVAEVVVPLVDRNLAGHQRGTHAVTILDDLQQIATVLVAQRREPPIIQNQQIQPSQPSQQTHERAVGAGHGELVDQARRSAIEDAVALAASLLALTQQTEASQPSNSLA
jgi:hypothetical protein